MHITTHNPQPIAEQALLSKPIEVEVEAYFIIIIKKHSLALNLSINSTKT